MDLNAHQLLVPAVMGGTAGFLGGAVAALAKQTTVRQVVTALLGGTGIGAFVGPASVSVFSLSTDVAGVVGFVGGLGIFGIIAGVRKLFDRFGDKPERVLPKGLRERMGIDSGESPQPSPPSNHRPKKHKRPEETDRPVRDDHDEGKPL